MLKWEQVINFGVRKAGLGQRVDFYVFRNDETAPYFQKPLSVYVDVK